MSLPAASSGCFVTQTCRGSCISLRVSITRPQVVPRTRKPRGRQRRYASLTETRSANSSSFYITRGGRSCWEDSTSSCAVAAGSILQQIKLCDINYRCSSCGMDSGRSNVRELVPGDEMALNLEGSPYMVPPFSLAGRISLSWRMFLYYDFLNKQHRIPIRYLTPAASNAPQNLALRLPYNRTEFWSTHRLEAVRWRYDR